MPVINTNTSAQFAQDALKANSKIQSTAMQQLATGNRINAAKDDAAGLSIGQNMTSQVRGLNQAVRNVNDGINMLQTADGALVETSNMLQRMRELAVQSSNATNSVSQRSYLNNEFNSLKTEITRISENTTWNNARLFGTNTGGTVHATVGTAFVPQVGTALVPQIGTALIPQFGTIGDVNYAAAVPASSNYAPAVPASNDYVAGYTEPKPNTFIFQAGANAGQTITINLASMDATGLSVDANTVETFDHAQAAITQIDLSIDKVNSARSTMGATMNQLNYSADNMINISTNIAASRSTVMDTDYATASAQLAKTQIISQAATAMLSQANQQPQSVLALLKG